jgi:hypothetical protein
MDEEARDQTGLLAHILRQRNTWLAVAIILACSALELYLDSQPQLPNFALGGAVLDLVKEAAAGVVVLLLGFLIAHVFLRHDREILSHGEIGRIAATVAEHVGKVVGTPPLDRTLLDDGRDNTQILYEADREVCISRESGQTLLVECNRLILKLLKDGCRFKIVLTDPDGPGLGHTVFRLSNSGKRDLQSRQQGTRGQLKRIFDAYPQARRLVELRYTPTALPGTVIITDPNRKGRRSEILYRQVGHLTTGNEERLSLRFDSVGSPRAAAVVTEEFFRIFRTSSKVVLLSNCDELMQYGVRELFPTFATRRRAAANQDGEGPFSTRLDGEGTPLSRLADPEGVFLVVFDRESVQDVEDRSDYRVWFGPAGKPATERRFAEKVSGSWKISLDTLRELRTAFDAAAAKGAALMIANVGPIALALPERCSPSELSEHDLRVSPAENRDFFGVYADPATGKLPLTLAPGLEALLDCRSTHLFIHFQADELVSRSSLYRAVADHDRTTILERAEAEAYLAEEMAGSTKAVAFTQARLSAL